MRSSTVQIGTGPATLPLVGHGFRLRPHSIDPAAPFPVIVQVTDARGVADEVWCWPGEWVAMQTPAIAATAWLASGSGLYQLDVGRNRDDVVLPAPPAAAPSVRWEPDFVVQKPGGDYSGDYRAKRFTRPAGYNRFLLFQNTPGIPTSLQARFYGKTPSGRDLLFHSASASLFGVGTQGQSKPLACLGPGWFNPTPAGYGPTLIHAHCPDAFDLNLYQGSGTYLDPVWFSACWERV
jgi:hypothetical protein